jgi:hypothetical protein
MNNSENPSVETLKQIANIFKLASELNSADVEGSGVPHSFASTPCCSVQQAAREALQIAFKDDAFGALVSESYYECNDGDDPLEILGRAIERADEIVADAIRSERNLS